MPAPARILARRAAILCCGWSFQLMGDAHAQNFTTQVADVEPLNLIGMMPSAGGIGLGIGEALKGGFGYGMGVKSSYDSNFLLDENATEDEWESDFAPQIRYSTDPEGGAPAMLTADYSPNYRNYLNHSDQNGLDQSGGVLMKVEGTKTRISAYARYSETAGTDRLAGQFVNASVVSTGVQASYQVAPRTSLSGSVGAAISDYGSSAVVGSEIYTGQFGAFWAATERLRFGPSIRYSMAKSDNTGSRDAWAFLMQAQYQAGERIAVSGSLGAESAKGSRETGNSTVRIAGDLTASYAISERWAWKNSVRYATVPAPTEVNYVVNNLMVSTLLNREFFKASAGIGMEMNVSDYVGVGSVTETPSTENNLSVFLSYQRTIFTERLVLDSRIRYAVNHGNTDWDKFLVTVGLNLQF